MEWDRGRSGGRELIDFASRPPPRDLEFNARLSVGAVTLTHCTSRPIEGRHLGAAQITAAIHDARRCDPQNAQILLLVKRPSRIGSEPLRVEPL